MFSDGSDVFHSDYFSGWDETKLQTVLDGCENESEAANPTAFCSSWLTYRWVCDPNITLFWTFASGERARLMEYRRMMRRLGVTWRPFSLPL